MKIVVIGPGALGCLLAASLTEQDRAETVLLDHQAGRAALLAAQGLLLTVNGREHRVPVAATADPGCLVRADVLLLCVKSQQVAPAMRQFGPYITTDSLLLTLQNGIGHLPLPGSQQATKPWAAGVTALGATLLGPGRTRFGGQGMTRFGFLPGADRRHAARLPEVAALFCQAGLPAVVVDNILEHIWAKFFINIGINALTAIHDCPNGDLLKNDTLKARMIAAVNEAVAVAKALAIPIRNDPVAAAMAVCEATACNLSSMLQDVRAGRPTEIAAINGALTREARKLGFPVPVNEALVQQIEVLSPRKS